MLNFCSISLIFLLYFPPQICYVQLHGCYELLIKFSCSSLLRSYYLPNEEKIRVNDEFYANWSQYLSDGIVVLKDPKGNCNSVHLGGHTNGGHYFFGVKRLIEFYCLSGHHHIQFLYNNCREFLIKIRSESMSEIGYPDFLSPLFVNQSEANCYSEEVFPSRCWNVRLTDAIVSGEKLMCYFVTTS